jgi:hypothetical protein
MSESFVQANPEQLKAKVDSLTVKISTYIGEAATFCLSPSVQYGLADLLMDSLQDELGVRVGEVETPNDNPEVTK